MHFQLKNIFKKYHTLQYQTHIYTFLELWDWSNDLHVIAILFQE
jgi:hypothetical protein